MGISSGKIDLKDGYKFAWYNQEGEEIYGWTESPNGQIVKGSSGWFRTIDPEAAKRVALSNLEYQIQAKSYS